MTFKTIKKFQIPDYNRDVVLVAIGKGQSGKSFLLEHILKDAEKNNKPSFYMDIMGELEPKRGRRFVKNFKEFREAINITGFNKFSPVPTVGTVVFQPTDSVFESLTTDQIFDYSIIILRHWSEKIKEKFPDGSRKLNIFFPELKEFTGPNSAPRSLRRLSTGGRHFFRIFYATQSALGQPSTIIGNSNIIISFNMHMPGDQKRILEISSFFDDIDKLPEYHFKMLDLKQKITFTGKI